MKSGPSMRGPVEPVINESTAIVSAEHAFRFPGSLIFKLFKSLKTMKIYANQSMTGSKSIGNHLARVYVHLLLLYAN